MVHDSDHIIATNDIIQFLTAAEFPNARWPGYLGSKVEVGGCVLAIPNVHRELKSGKLLNDPRGEVAEPIKATKRLQATSRESPTEADLEAYLEGHRPGYRAGLFGGWDVGGGLKMGHEACGIEFSPKAWKQIAYLNASCCQVPGARCQVPRG